MKWRTVCKRDKRCRQSGNGTDSVPGTDWVANREMRRVFWLYWTKISICLESHGHISFQSICFSSAHRCLKLVHNVVSQAHTPYSQCYSSTNDPMFFLKWFYILPLNYWSVLSKQLTYSEHYTVFINKCLYMFCIVGLPF